MQSDSTQHADDRTTRARIRDAAIESFAASGVDGTSLKVIAEAAGVSQALILHHFGSKQALRTACDEYVAAVIGERKREAFGQGPRLDLFAALSDLHTPPAAIHYLARTVGDGSPAVARLVDDMVRDAVDYLDEGERQGLVRPSDCPRERAVVLVLWSLGLVTLHEHVERLLGVDVAGDPRQLGPYLVPALEILSRGVLSDDLYEQARGAFVSMDRSTPAGAPGEARSEEEP